MIAATPLEENIAEIISPTVAGLGLELVRVRMMGGDRQTLQVMAERPDGTMDVGTCARRSRDISAVLDVEDPIREGYRLEVSSPGIDRPLTRLSDFVEFTGHRAKIELKRGIGGQKRWQGILAGADETGRIELSMDKGDPLVVAFTDLASARLVLTDKLIKAAGRSPQET